MPSLRHWALLFVVAATFLPAVASAEVIDSMTSDIIIKPDSSAQVQEVIQYDFEGAQRHGIYRDIPLSFSSADGRAQAIRIDHISVTDETGRSLNASVSRNGDSLRIQIGDSNALVTGKKTYTIFYTVEHAITPYGSFDEIYWNATGDQWQVPIKAASASVVLPTRIASSSIQAACYQGVRGSKTPCIIIKNFNASGPTVISFFGSTLYPGQGLTIAAGFPKGLVTFPTWQQTLWRDYKFVIAGTALLIAAIIFAIFFILNDRKGRGTIIPEYEPPTKLRPAEVEVLLHNGIRGKAWPATIVDLAIRGFLKIEELERQWWQWHRDYTLTRTRSADTGFEPFEQDFLTVLFRERAVFSTQEMRKDRFASQKLYLDLQSVESSLRKETASDSGAYLLDPETASNRLGIALGVTIIFGIIFCVFPYFIDILAGYVDAGLALGLVILSAFIGAYPVYLRPRLNAQGSVEREAWLGFKLYLEKAEKYRLQNLTPDQFEKFLPYAMVFGVEKKWAKAFAGLTVPPPSWYSGSAANAGAFSAASFTSGFSSSFSSSFAATGAGGASGGGGGAGGGGGGGGGGSW